MLTERTHPYLFWGLVCAIAVSGLVIAVCLYPSVARYHFVKTHRDKVFEVVAMGSFDDVKYYIKRGVSVHEKTPAGMSLLHCAVRFNPDVEVLKYLVEQGADVNAKNNNDMTPLHYAAMPDNSSIEKLLPFATVSPNPSIEKIKYLIEKGANVNAKNDSGMTPLDYVRDNKEKEAILREAGGKRGKELPE